MATQMTRKESATIIKKYEKYGMVGIHLKKTPAPKEEYYIAKQIWKQRVEESKK